MTPALLGPPGSQSDEAGAEMTFTSSQPDRAELKSTRVTQGGIRLRVEQLEATLCWISSARNHRSS
jgi:hypothetical protein